MTKHQLNKEKTEANAKKKKKIRSLLKIEILTEDLTL